MKLLVQKHMYFKYWETLISCDWKSIAMCNSSTRIDLIEDFTTV